MLDPAESTAVAAAPDVLVQCLPDGESVFLNLVTEEYFALDPVGTAMWTELTGAGSTGPAMRGLLDRFDVDEETLARDLSTLVATLSDRGLLLVGDDALAEARAPAPD